MVTDWVGLLDECSENVEEFFTELKQMHAKSQTIVDLIENLAKFAEIQVEDYRLDVMDDMHRDSKTTLQQFLPTIQVEYIMLQ
jgi:hypothetical protein